jgi:succinate dehydrogenase / fumarate reductase cytochrome b subunit
MLPKSTVGKKIVMAVTGILLVGFVIGHMAGNLKIYTGREHFNAYALALREFGADFLGYSGALWIARVALLVAVVLHIASAYQLARASQAARPVRYAQPKAPDRYAARTMRWGGVILLLFIVYHLLHFTFGAVGYAPGQFVHMDAYNNVVAGFRVWYVSLFYILAMVALGFHLSHGVFSMFQTLGVQSQRAQRGLDVLGPTVAAIVVAGNVSVPLAVMMGLVR